jgi:hypothetical protein
MPHPFRRAVARARHPLVAESALDPSSIVPATLHDAGFELGDSCYNALHAAGDGRVYYAIGCKRADTAARLLAFDPATCDVRLVADMNEATGEAALGAIPQGKVHTPLLEHDGRLLLATHVGCYAPSAGRERIARVAGRAPYPGGHFVALRIADATVASLGRAPSEEGIIAATLDAGRGVLHGLTWPGGVYVRHRLGESRLDVLGPALGAGERGRGPAWMHVCRSVGLDPETGDVFLTDTRGTILVCRDGRILRYERCAFAPGGLRQSWRTIRWFAPERVFYGVAMRSGALFRFCPARGVVEVLASLQPPAVPDAAWWRSTPPATLAFELDGRTGGIRALATGPSLAADDGRRVRSTVYLVTCDRSGRDVAWHGPLRLADGRHPTFAQSLASAGGRLHAVAWVELPEQSGDERVRRLRRVRQELGVPEPHGELEELNLVSFADPASSSTDEPRGSRG